MPLPKWLRWLDVPDPAPPPKRPPALQPWTREDVWTTLVALFVDQQGLKPEQVRYHARINTDLGIA